MKEKELKVYEKLGLTDNDVLAIQKWMFPMMSETGGVAEMITKTEGHFTDTKHLHYALYLIGAEIGQARIKDKFGLVHELDPNNLD